MLELALVNTDSSIITNSDYLSSLYVLSFPSYIFYLLTNASRNIWFEAATVVAVPPPIEISTGSVLKSALAGGLASALSTSLLHPIDSMKVQ
jgi:phosphatidylinositol phospholipase C delta